MLKRWDQRKRPASVLQPLIQKAVNTVVGQHILAVPLPALPGSAGLPIQFVIGTTNSFDQLDTVAQRFLAKTRASGLFIVLNTDLRVDDPQVTIAIGRRKAALMGITMKNIGSVLKAMLGGGYAN